MGVVIGKGGHFYEIPNELLDKYRMSEEKVKTIKERLESIKVNVEEPEVEGYGDFSMYGLTNIWELLGIVTTGPVMPVDENEKSLVAFNF